MISRRPFGNTGLQISALGFGAGEIGDPNMPEENVWRLLDQAFDAGINLIDSARSYGVSEQRLGQWCPARRQSLVLSTKVGYDVGGHNNWTTQAVSIGIDEALQKWRTDYLDIVHLHSCDLATLQRGEVIEALLLAKQQGKLRFAAYSGENDALAYAVECNAFASIQCSYNVLDQRNVTLSIAMAKARGMGVMAKRPLANAVWRFDALPTRDDWQIYWHRWQKMDSDKRLDAELALRFSAYGQGIDCALIGSGNTQRLQQCLDAFACGALPDDASAYWQQQFSKYYANAPSLI